MERLLEEALAGGAWGLSSGLFTAPGNFADAAEIHALARVLRRHGAAYSTHVRDEANAGFEAVREAIAVAEATGVHVQIAHLKLSGSDNWGGAAKLLAEITAARQRGLPVDCDAYPYDTATNPLRNLLPRWVMENGIPAMLERLRSRDVRTRHARGDRAARAHQLRAHPVVGRRARGHLASPARERRPHAGRHRAEPWPRSDRRRVADYVVADRGETRILITSMADADVARDHARAVGHRRLGRQRAGHLGRYQPGQAASALLRHPHPGTRPLRARPCAC